MGKLTYDGRCWVGHDETMLIRMSDKTFQRHLNAYLESLGMPTQTLLELMEFERWVCEQRFQAAQQLANLDRWRGCDDPDIRVIRLR